MSKNEKSTGATKVMPIIDDNTIKKSKPKNQKTTTYTDKDSIESSNQALFDSIDSYKKSEMTIDEYWERIFYVHLKTKELYILAEEYGSELQTFFLPINGLKNAYEHVIHICANDYMSRTDGTEPNKKYALDNLRKALEYENKAFFDTADFLSILLRKKIAEDLNNFTYPQISSVWDDYNTVRLQLIKVNQEISEIRNRKTETNDYYIDEDVEKYYIETKNLLNWYIFIEEKVYPRLEERFGDIN